jgi:cytochrome b subunit of formate dehydrogenase
MKYLLFMEKTRPDIGRFGIKEKFEYFGVFWGTVLLGLTGILMWGNAWFTKYVPGRILTIAVIIHTFEALLALLHVGVVHLIGVIFAPSVLPVSRAMFTGATPPDEMAEAHAGMLEETAGKLSLASSGGEPS